MIRVLPIALTGLLVATTASATPRPLPMTYTYDTLAQGEGEVEVYADLVPVGALSTSSGAPTRYLATQFQTEFEYGISNRLELGLYATFVPGPGDAYSSTPTMPEGNGVKQRLRLRLADEGRWPVDVGLYGELVETERNVEIEARVILARRFGNLRLVANLVAEYELYYSGSHDLEFAPSVGVTYQATSVFHPGIEYWMHVEFPDPAPVSRPFNVQMQQYVGPTALLNFGRIWWSLGAYLRVSEIGRSIAPGDLYGEFWARTVVGITL